MPTDPNVNLQLAVPFDKVSDKREIFRPIHYLGSKLRILDFLEGTLNEIDPTMGRVYDLFSGSGVVSSRLSLSRPVTSIDIQEYSRVLCSALLNPKIDPSVSSQIFNKCQNSEFSRKLRWAAEPLVLYEENAIRLALSGKPELLCDLLEMGSIISFEKGVRQDFNKTDIYNSITETIGRLKSFGWLKGPNALCLRFAGGIYFSYRQAIDSDIILHQVHQLPSEIKDSFLAPLLGTLSNLANTVGKQFAQPIRPRESNGNIKPNLGQRVNKDRMINVFKEYDSWIQRYLTIIPNQFDHHSFRMDYLEALDNISEDTTIVYADPPYTRDHYSRYYHTLETICLRDMPEISTMVLNGKTQISRGLYRKERHQSPFCIKSQAGEAFEKLVSKSHSKGLDLIISYSPYDESKKTHPRLLKMDQLIQTAKTFYKNVSVRSPGVFSHSKLNRFDKHLEASEHAEVLVICKA